MTRTALATLEAMGPAGDPLRDALARAGRDLLVPRSLLDELDEEVADLAAHGDQPMRSMSAGPSGLTMEETAPEAVAALLARRRALRAWVDERTRAVPRPMSEVGVAGRARRERYGTSSADALALARAGRGTLWADDLGLRRIEASRGAVPGCSTWSLVQAFRQAGHVTEDEAHRAVMALLHLRHTFLPVSAALLYRVLRDGAFAMGSDTILALDQLSGEDVTTESAAGVVAELLRLVALDPVGAGALRPVTMVCLERLTRGHRVEPVLRELGRLAAEQLRYLPVHAGIIEECMQRFNASHLAGGSLR